MNCYLLFWVKPLLLLIQGKAIASLISRLASPEQWVIHQAPLKPQLAGTEF
jgi:hypothetical protein